MSYDKPPEHPQKSDEDTAEARQEDTKAFSVPDATFDSKRTSGLKVRQEAHESQRVQPTRMPTQTQGGRTQHVEPVARPQTATNQTAPVLTAAPRAKRPKRQRNKAEESALYFPWWSLVLLLFGVLVVSVGLVGLVYILGNTSGDTTEPTAIIRIITANPTEQVAQQLIQPTALAPATIIIAGGNAPSQLALAGPTLEAVLFTPTPVAILVGSRVEVDGVEEQQLNIRDIAGVMGTTILVRANEGEIFTVINGPAQADGFTWWQIQDPANPSRSGWAVSNYLKVVVNP